MKYHLFVIIRDYVFVVENNYYFQISKKKKIIVKPPPEIALLTFEAYPFGLSPTMDVT